MKGLPSVESLESVHAFPCPYTFKVFGPGTSSVVEDARAVALRHIEDAHAISLSTRESSRGSYVCVSLTVTASSAEQVRELYRSLVRLQSVRYLL